MPLGVMDTSSLDEGESQHAQGVLVRIACLCSISLQGSCCVQKLPSNIIHVQAWRSHHEFLARLACHRTAAQFFDDSMMQ
jgi:hypothetical protein